MRTEFLDELGDALFAIAMAGAIGLGIANLAVQVTQERIAFDAAASGHNLDQLTYPRPADAKDIRPEATDQLNF
ncbi:MAG TPA: hypothetical protein VKP67_23100 [Xanthobacteraceae bacterium]|nr:hypothetical protein [Xanthobacteraceae bacterium]